jgi:hypothetical protein
MTEPDQAGSTGERELAPWEKAEAFMNAWPGATEEPASFGPDEQELIFVPTRPDDEAASDQRVPEDPAPPAAERDEADKPTG